MKNAEPSRRNTQQYVEVADVHTSTLNGYFFTQRTTVQTEGNPMRYVYGWKWNPRQRRVIDELTEEMARTTFDEGPQLGVIALPQTSDVPAYTLELNAQARDVVVTHYTSAGSVASQMHYRTLPDNETRLFLEHRSEWLCTDDETFHSFSKADVYLAYSFSTDGIAELRRRIRGTGTERVEQFSDVDVSDHWRERLAWGDWDSIGTRHFTSNPGSGG